MELTLMPYRLAVVLVIFFLRDCNAQALTFTLGTASIQENSAAGTSVQALAASGGTAGYTYTIASGSSNFSIATDELQVASGTTILDFEGQNTYTLTIQVVDSAGTPATVSATLTVSLTDVNEAPTFSPSAYSVTLYHGNAGGTTVGTFTATDVDASPNGISSYTIASGNDGLTFTNTNGLITVASGKTLNSATQSAYILTLDAVDAGPLTATATIYIAVCTSGTAPIYLGFLAVLATLTVQLAKYL